MIVCGKQHAGHFMNFLGSGKEYGVKLSYALQDRDNGGIADALSYSEDFADGENIAVILGDNIFTESFEGAVRKFESGGMVFLKEVTRLYTWQIEAVIVAIVLISTALLSGKGLIEFLGVGAVFFSWMHASVANSLQEAQRLKERQQVPVEVHCYRWLARYFYIKEILWCGYFFYLGAWSALAGVFIFLFYQFWKKIWWEYEQQLSETQATTSC